MKILFVPIASPIHDKRAVDLVVRRYRDKIEPYVDEVFDLVTRPQDVPRGFDAYVVLVVTGGSEHIALEIANEDKPVLLIAHDRMNSLPATLEAYSKLREENKLVWIASLEDPVYDVKSFVKAVKAWMKLRGARIGVIGGVSHWLVYSRVERDSLKKLGIELVEIPLDKLIELINSISDEETSQYVDKIINNAIDVRVPRESVVKAVKVYIALKKLVEEYNLAGFTIKCFDLILRHNVSACLALAMLNSEGIIAGCEGDVPAAITMLISQLLTGYTGFLANVAWILDDEIQLAHCTIAFNLVENYSLDTHFETNKSVGVEGYVKTKRVSLIKISPKLDRLRVIVGDLITGEPISRMLCRTQVVVKTSNSRKILDDPMGNHYIVVPEDIKNEAKFFAHLARLKLDTN
ncbi:hypothetical protein J4526_06575 [Desulfurococcaceae archaeon MEX13E-LK6-19]|nr:hypothetical protein J4526_06575 [Desulfurococcaceae archaeon MEX13E-LK6-19]